MNCRKCGKELGYNSADSIAEGICSYCKSIETLKEIKNQPFVVLPNTNYLLLIEDGSVDTKKLDSLGIQYLVYRQGSQKPELIKIGE